MYLGLIIHTPNPFFVVLQATEYPLPPGKALLVSLLDFLRNYGDMQGKVDLFEFPCSNYMSLSFSNGFESFNGH